MKFDRPIKWRDFPEKTKILFFIHRCQEMLYRYTIEKYRMPVLNTHQLVKEYCSVVVQVEKEVIKPEFAEKIQEEFIDTLKTDYAIKYGWGELNAEYFIEQWGKLSNPEKRKQMFYLRDILAKGTYLKWCKNALYHACSANINYAKLENICRSIVPELIALGYSVDYLYHKIQNILKSKIVSAEDFFNFMDSFNLKSSEHRVYIGISKKYPEIIDVLIRRFNCTSEDDGYFGKFKLRRDCQLICFQEIRALDEYSAMSWAMYKIEIFIKFFGLLSNKHAPMIQKYGMVKTENSEELFFVETRRKELNIIFELEDKDAISIAENSISTLLKNIPIRQFSLLERAIDLHNAALSVQDYRNSFLNLWSIFETIITPEKGKSKIERIIEVVSNVLKCDWLDNVLIDLDKNLKCNIPDKYNELLVLVNDDTAHSSVEKLIHIIYDDKYEDIRKSLYSELSDFPVISYRINKFHKDFEKPNGITKEITKYCRRVGWHLYRLYLTRNLIVHSGQRPKHIQILSEHLHYYVDALLLEIIYAFIKKPNIASIENVLTEIMFKNQVFESQIKSISETTSQNILAILEWDVNLLKN